MIHLVNHGEELHNKCHSPEDGKFCPGPDGPGRIREIANPAQKEKAEENSKKLEINGKKLAKIALGVGAVAVGAGLIYVGGNIATTKVVTQAAAKTIGPEAFEHAGKVVSQNHAISMRQYFLTSSKMNDFLRTNPAALKTNKVAVSVKKPGTDDIVTAKVPYSEFVTHIDDVIESSPGLADNTTLYRGVAVRDANNPFLKAVQSGDAVGEEIIDKGFGSTSVDERIAFRFSEGPGADRILLEIDAPKGTKGAYLSGRRENFYSESEYLLGRGAKVKITSVEEINFTEDAIEGGRTFKVHKVKADLVDFEPDALDLPTPKPIKFGPPATPANVEVADFDLPSWKRSSTIGLGALTSTSGLAYAGTQMTDTKADKQVKDSNNKVAKQREASIPFYKKGERIVRTPEGAKRFGVPIGQPVPENYELSDTMVKENKTTATGLIRTNTQDVHEFFNPHHDSETGEFDEGPDGPGRIRDIKDPDKRKAAEEKLEEQKEEIAKEKQAQAKTRAQVEADLKKKFGEDSVKNIEAAGHTVEDYNFYDQKTGELSGKPIPGSDSWLDAHGIDKKLFQERPVKRYSGSQDPVLDELYADEDDPGQKRFAKKLAGQSDGFVMVRKPVPGAEEAGFGPIPPQLRPDNKVVVDGETRARKTRELANAETRLETVNGFTTDDLITEREARVAKAKKNLKDIQTKSPEDLIAIAERDITMAKKGLRKAEKTGDEEAIAEAKLAVSNAEFKAKGVKNTAFLAQKDRERAVGLAQQELNHAQRALEKAKENPEKTLENVQEYAKNQVKKKEDQLDKTAVKYAFPPGEGSASRIETHHDPKNLKNLTEGNGKVYFVMEGQIKADAVLTAVRKEDPKAAVMSVPSVTAWNEKEVAWVAETYLKGRDVVLIPDSDGVNNRNVVNQAKTLQGLLRGSGTNQVLLASPPLIKDKRGNEQVEEIFFPTGKKDERKGVDDHLGLGKGTLGDLVFEDTKPPSFDISKDKPIRKDAVGNTNKTLNAISDLAGQEGIGRVSKNALTKYTGLPETTTGDSIKRLEKQGVIKVHHIFDPKSAGQGRRVLTMEPSEVKRLTKRAGVPLPDLDTEFVSDDNKYETAPIIEVLDKKYITRSGAKRNLKSEYKNLKTSTRASVPNDKPSGVGIRRVRTPEGAKRYGVPIGNPIPEDDELQTTGQVTMVKENSSVHGPTGIIRKER